MLGIKVSGLRQATQYNQILILALTGLISFILSGRVSLKLS